MIATARIAVVGVLAVAMFLTSAAAAQALAPIEATSGAVASTGPRTDVAPMSQRSKADTLKRNKLYRSKKLHAAGCQAESKVALNKVSNVQKYYTSVLSCLNRTWKQLRKSGVPFSKPKVRVHTGKRVSVCGARKLSFYCPPERTIYMYANEIITPWKKFAQPYGRNLTRLAAAHTIAHEYGHHIQWVTKIGPALGPNFYGTQSERRLELQASCLGNIFLSSQSLKYPISGGDFADEKLWRFIQVSNHGSVQNQRLWTHRGYRSAKPGSCNTFTAPSRQVR